MLAFYRDKFATPNEQRQLAGEVAVGQEGDRKGCIGGEVIITGPVLGLCPQRERLRDAGHGHYRDLARPTEDGLRLARQEISFRSRRIDHHRVARLAAR